MPRKSLHESGCCESFNPFIKSRGRIAYNLLDGVETTTPFVVGSRSDSYREERGFNPHRLVFWPSIGTLAAGTDSGNHWRGSGSYSAIFGHNNSGHSNGSLVSGSNNKISSSPDKREEGSNNAIIAGDSNSVLSSTSTAVIAGQYNRATGANSSAIIAGQNSSVYNDESYPGSNSIVSCCNVSLYDCHNVVAVGINSKEESTVIRGERDKLYTRNQRVLSSSHIGPDFERDLSDYSNRVNGKSWLGGDTVVGGQLNVAGEVLSNGRNLGAPNVKLIDISEALPGPLHIDGTVDTVLVYNGSSSNVILVLDRRDNSRPLTIKDATLWANVDSSPARSSDIEIRPSQGGYIETGATNSSNSIAQQNGSFIINGNGAAVTLIHTVKNEESYWAVISVYGGSTVVSGERTHRRLVRPANGGAGYRIVRKLP
jgi:hypothetical protein